jgi:hypothetical protein
VSPSLGEHEAARVIGVSVHTLRKWRGMRRGPAFLKFRGAARKGRGNAGRVVYREEDLLAFLDAVTVPTETPPMPITSSAVR